MCSPGERNRPPSQSSLSARASSRRISLRCDTGKLDDSITGFAQSPNHISLRRIGQLANPSNPGERVTRTPYLCNTVTEDEMKTKTTNLMEQHIFIQMRMVYDINGI